MARINALLDLVPIYLSLHFSGFDSQSSSDSLSLAMTLGASSGALVQTKRLKICTSDHPSEQRAQALEGRVMKKLLGRLL